MTTDTLNLADWISTREACARLGMSRSRVCQMLRLGMLKGIVPTGGTCWLVSAQSVAALPEHDPTKGGRKRTKDR